MLYLSPPYNLSYTFLCVIAGSVLGGRETGGNGRGYYKKGCQIIKINFQNQEVTKLSSSLPNTTPRSPFPLRTNFKANLSV